MLQLCGFTYCKNPASTKKHENGKALCFACVAYSTRSHFFLLLSMCLQSSSALLLNPFHGRIRFVLAKLAA